MDNFLLTREQCRAINDNMPSTAKYGAVFEAIAEAGFIAVVDWLFDWCTEHSATTKKLPCNCSGCKGILHLRAEEIRKKCTSIK